MEDYEYAEGLYVRTMKPLLSDLGGWDELDALTKFRSYYKPDEIQVITLGGRDIGFFQVVRNADSLDLDQIHIEAPYCSHGIGTALIRELLSEARATERPVKLSFAKRNRAQALYERLGFRVIGENETRVHMRWDP